MRRKTRAKADRAAIVAFMDRVAHYDADHDVWTFRMPDVSGITVTLLADEVSEVASR